MFLRTTKINELRIVMKIQGRDLTRPSCPSFWSMFLRIPKIVWERSKKHSRINGGDFSALFMIANINKMVTMMVCHRLWRDVDQRWECCQFEGTEVAAIILECFFECSHTILGIRRNIDQYEGHEIAPLNIHNDSQFVYFSGPKEHSEN